MARNMNVPSSWTPDKKHSDRERWVCIYPAYINSKKSLAEGRKISKDKAVENPTYQEIRDVLSSAGLKVGFENKLYSREKSKEIQYRGRVRVQLKNDDGTAVNTNFETRTSIMVYLGEMIPKLKTRVSKHGGSESGPSQPSGGGSKKKGKGRR